LDAIKAKLAVWSKDKRLVRIVLTIAAIVLVLLLTCCISILMRANIQKKYSASISEMQELTYAHMTTMTELFSRIDDPNVDVRNKLIPELKAQYTAVSSINSVLQSCGKRHALLDEEQIAAFDAAFEEYTTAYQHGSPTGLAKADMAACMEDVQALVTQHNAPPKDDQDEVVIINASSGKIEKSSQKNDKN